MPDEREYQSLVKDAERAVGASDFARANVTLREALRLQEAALGALHPEVASTLNNLAVVSETLGRMDEAEGYFRRAYAIASAALPPNDPLVVTSRENLKDFCAAVDHPLEDWPDLELSHAAPTVAPPAAPPAAPAPAPPPWATAAPPRHSAAPAPTRAPAPTPVRARTSARASAPPAAASTAPRRPGSPVRTGQRSWTAPMMGVLAVLAIVGALVAARSWRAASSDRARRGRGPSRPRPGLPPGRHLARRPGRSIALGAGHSGGRAHRLGGAGNSGRVGGRSSHAVGGSRRLRGAAPGSGVVAARRRASGQLDRRAGRHCQCLRVALDHRTVELPGRRRSSRPRSSRVLYARGFAHRHAPAAPLVPGEHAAAERHAVDRGQPVRRLPDVQPADPLARLMARRAARRRRQPAARDRLRGPVTAGYGVKPSAR